MSELEETLELANRILDRPYADPDDDLAMLARNLVRQHEAAAAWKALALPEQLTIPVRQVLSLMCFTTGPMARVLRLGGWEIDTRGPSGIRPVFEARR